MTATVRYVAPLLWQGTSPTTNIRQANPVVWAGNLPQINVRQAMPVVWSYQMVTAYIRGLTAMQWIITPIPLQLRQVTGLQWSQDLITMTARRVTALQWTQDALSASIRSLKAVTWVTLPTNGSLRQASAYTLQKSSTQGQLRQASAYTLQLNRKFATTGGLAGLWPLIQADATVTVNASNLSVSAPVVDATQPNCNTYVSVSPIGTLAATYAGSYKLYYHRQDISYAFNGLNNTWKLGTISSATTILSLLSQINSQYGMAFDPTDIVDGPVAANATSLLLTVASGSYVYKPGTQVWLQTTVPLTTAIGNTNLPGFASASGVGPTNNTSLLMHFDGANGSTTFTDLVGHTVTAVGAAALSTTQSKFGGSSLAPNATTGAVSVTDRSDLHLAGDFTIEFFTYLTDTNNNPIFVCKGPNAQIGITTNKFTVQNDATNSYIITSSAAAPIGSWVHVALTRAGNVWTLWVNGVSAGTYTGTSSFGNNSSALIIGNFNSGSFGPHGYIDEFRISALARYTAPFTPPASAFVQD